MFNDLSQKIIFTLSLFCIWNSVYGQRFVNPSGTCSGGTPCYTTISAAVSAASAGETITVDDGTYNENVTIDKNLTLISLNGRENTTIQGSPGPIGSVIINNNTTGVTVQGFHIIGYDNANPGVEYAALYVKGSHSNIKILNNEIEAVGEAGLIFEFGATIDNVTIDGNIFSGKTFVGAEPGGCGFGNQFSLHNVPRALLFIGPEGSKSNITLTNNMFTGQAGGVNALCGPGGQGNTLVMVDVNGANITGNTFSGQTARFATLLRTRGMNTSISGNTFDLTNSSSSESVYFLFKDMDALDGGSPSDLEGVLSANIFTPAGVIGEDNSSIVRCVEGINCPLAPIPTMSQWGLIVLCFFSLILGLVFLRPQEATIPLG
jgi:hypothetical protein